MPHPLMDASSRVALAAYLHDLGKFAEPEFDSSKAHFRPTPSNGAGFRAMGRQKPRYTGC